MNQVSEQKYRKIVPYEMIRDGDLGPLSKEDKNDPTNPLQFEISGPQDQAAVLPCSPCDTYVSVDLGDSGAQVQHGGDGADGKANDLTPGERLEGKGAASSPCVQRHASHACHGSVQGDSGAKTQPLISPSIPHPAEHSAGSHSFSRACPPHRTLYPLSPHHTDLGTCSPSTQAHPHERTAGTSL